MKHEVEALHAHGIPPMKHEVEALHAHGGTVQVANCDLLDRPFM